MRFVNGLVMFMDGSRPQMGNAPKDVVMTRGKLQVARLRPRSDEEYEIGTDTFAVRRGRFPVPVLLIPPLMVRPYVYDLRPDHSMARTLRDRGYDVFIVDFGVPDREDEGIRLDDYVLDFVPRAVDAALKASGQSQVTLAGYCMGGIFALLHAATHRDERVKNIVTVGAPVNFAKMGVVTVAARIGSRHVDGLLDRIGNVPAFAAIQGFKLMSGPKAITKYADLFLKLYDEQYVRGFDAVNTWVNDLLPYPKEAFKQLVKDVVSENKLLQRTARFGDKLADLETIRQPLLAFAGSSDNIATPASTRDILDIVGSADKRLYEVPGGHVGVVAGNAAPAKVWRPMAEWLATRSI
jgi:polyhydroxyalkanoate synthase